MKFYRIVSFVLAAALALGGCAKGDVASKDTIKHDTSENDGYFSDRNDLDDGLAGYENAFKDFSYRVVVSDDNDKFVIADADDADVVSQAVYRRNISVEERFGCKIEIVKSGTYQETRDYISQSVLSAEDLFDMAYHHVVSQGMLALNDYYVNWYDVPGVDFSRPWWSSSTTEQLSYDGRCYIAIGDFALSALSNAYCVFYNKTDAERYQLPNLYDVVNEGDWTIDYVLELTRDIYEDINRNNQVDDADFFGYVSDSRSNVNAYLWSFNNPVFSVDDDGIEIVYKTEKIGDIITKLVDATTKNEIRVNTSYINREGEKALNYGIELFSNGQALLSNGYIGQSLSYLRDMADPYGILPYPKWDDSQSDYYTMADGNHTSFAIPKTVSVDRLEFIGVITEALCYESYKTLVPVYYEEALKLKGTRDDESMKMIDLIVNSCVYDMGYVYGGYDSFSFYIQRLVSNGDANFESFYASNSGVGLDYYEKVINYFEFGEVG